MSDGAESPREVLILVFVMLLGMLIGWGINFATNLSGRHSLEVQAVKLGYAQWNVTPEGEKTWKWIEPQTEDEE